MRIPDASLYTHSDYLLGHTRQIVSAGMKLWGGKAQKGQATIAGSSAPQGKRVRGVHDNAFIASEW